MRNKGKTRDAILAIVLAIGLGCSVYTGYWGSLAQGFGAVTGLSSAKGPERPRPGAALPDSGEKFTLQERDAEGQERDAEGTEKSVEAVGTAGVTRSPPAGNGLWEGKERGGFNAPAAGRVAGYAGVLAFFAALVRLVDLVKKRRFLRQA